MRTCQGTRAAPGSDAKQVDCGLSWTPGGERHVVGRETIASGRGSTVGAVKRSYRTAQPFPDMARVLLRHRCQRGVSYLPREREKEASMKSQEQQQQPPVDPIYREIP